MWCRTCDAGFPTASIDIIVRSILQLQEREAQRSYLPKIKVILCPFLFQVHPPLLPSESSFGTPWTSATYVSMSEIPNRAGLASAKRFWGQANGNWWKREKGKRKRAASGQTGQWSTPIPLSESGGNGPHISRPAEDHMALWRTGPPRSFSALGKNYGLLISWCV